MFKAPLFEFNFILFKILQIKNIDSQYPLQAYLFLSQTSLDNEALMETAMIYHGNVRKQKDFIQT